MGPSKIQLKVQHKNHEKQTKQSKTESIEKQKSQKKLQKSGAQLGKSKSKEKQQLKSVAQQSSLKDQKIQKSKSKDKKDSKLNEKSSEKKDIKEDKKNDKSQKDKAKQKDKNKNKNKKEQKDNKQEKGKRSKNDKKKEKQEKSDKKGKNDKKGKKDKVDSEQQDQKAMVKSKQKRALDRELETISNINKQTTKAKLTIGELIQLYKDASYDIFVNHGHNSEKEKEIEEELQRLKRQKERRRKRLEELGKSAEAKKRQKQLLNEENEKKKKQRIIQKRKKNISLRLENLTQQAKKRKQEHHKFQQYASQRKSHQPRYKKYEKHFKQFEHSLKQQQQQILQERRLKAAPLDYEELQKFKESYEEQKIEALEHSERKMELQQEIIEQENQWMKNLFKGKAYMTIQEEGRRNPLIEEHQTAKEKLQKARDYAKIVKSQFIDQEDKDEQDDEERNRVNYDSQEVRYRQKHKLGKSLGLIPEKRVKPLTHDQKVKMGALYLQQLRKLPRKGLKTIQTPLKSQRIGRTYIMKKPTNPFYSLQRSGTSFDAKNPRQIELTMEQLRSKDFSTALQEKSLHYMQYAGVTELQKRHSDVNRRLIGDISSKLDVLKKLVN